MDDTAQQVEVLQHDIAFLARALVKTMEVAGMEEASQVQALVDFYEERMDQ